MTRTVRPALFALWGAAALVLAGCASSSPAPGGSASPTPTTSESPSTPGEALEVDAAWLDGGRTIALITNGSSSCVPLASDVTVQADGVVAVTLADLAGAACTRDYVPRATAVGLPEGADAAKGVDIVVTYGEVQGETDLAAYTGPAVDEGTPSAGWFDDGQFAILTWGSSSCKPVIEEVAAASETSATVTFTQWPADQVCTADFAPRIALAFVDGVSKEGSTVTLNGADFTEPVTIPIAG